MKTSFTQSTRLLPAFLLALSLTSGTRAAEAHVDELPSLVVAYHVAPVSRPGFRQELETSGLRQFQRWKNEGILSSYRILFSRYADSDNWDAMALLAFPSVADVERWKNIERTHPAGLPPKALALVTSIHTNSLSKR
jgi:hypothetical protein